MVIWLLGVSGSGKTTLGNKVVSYLNNKNIPNSLIDGDIVRDFFDNDLGYSKEERIANIKRIMLATYMLEKNGVIPIVCNISPFQELRDFARSKFNNYNEIYLQRELSEINNKDDVYKDANVVGVDLEFDEPKHADLIINTALHTEEESLNLIIKKIGI